MKDNETEKSTSLGKKRVLAIILTACALILAAAIVFTVVMVSQDAAVSIEKPNGDDTDKDDEDGEDNDGEDNDDEDDTPSGGEMVFSLPVDGTISTSYTFWYNSTLNRYNLHEGIDFKAEAGTNVAAAYDGTVSSVTDTLLEGGCIVIDHGGRPADGLCLRRRPLHPQSGRYRLPRGSHRHSLGRRGRHGHGIQRRFSSAF